jgi:hypothetical protein
MAKANTTKPTYSYGDDEEDTGVPLEAIDDGDDDGDDEEDDSPEIEVEDDTPPEDRDRSPMPKEIVDELENDELEEYSEKVKLRLKQMKKVYHDERREKERVQREQQEAVAIAKNILDENRRLKNTLSTGEKQLLDSYKAAAASDMAEARRVYIEAHETGDSEKLVQAQERITAAALRMQQLDNYRSSLQREPEQVYEQKAAPEPPRLDPKTDAWQKRNTWWGTDEEMTATALGLHQKLEKQNGKNFVGTDEYWRAVDTTMRRRFPEYFGNEPSRAGRDGKRATNVVAPASRSTSSRKVVLTKTQLALAKQFGLTPEQYAKEALRLENNNG